MLMDYILGKLTSQHYPKVESSRCLQLSSTSNMCRKCKEICPNEAIDFKSGKVSLNKDLCNSCGICKGACPTQGINMKGIGEENVLRTIRDKDNIIFSCSQKNGIGTLKLTCLNALHPELLAALLIQYHHRRFYFNISRCKNCKLNKKDNLLFSESLEKAESFVKLLGINPECEIVENEENIRNISEKSISRRELFNLLKKESRNIATQAVDTIITDQDHFLAIRPILLNAMGEKSDLIIDREINTKTLLGTWNVTEDCDGCGDCQATCPNGAWKVDVLDKNLNIYHNAAKCYQCGKCEEKCPKKAIEKGNLLTREINKNCLKRQMVLSKCPLCHKDFVSKQEESICSICRKKEEMRRRIASF